jgi:transcriptional regulator with XRE-family HTH domain
LLNQTLGNMVETKAIRSRRAASRSLSQRDESTSLGDGSGGLRKSRQPSSSVVYSDSGAAVAPSDALPTEFGKRLATLRVDRNITQGEMGKALNKSRTTINQYEGGGIAPPLSVIIEIAKILDVDEGLLAFGKSAAVAHHITLFYVDQGDGLLIDSIGVSIDLMRRLRMPPETGRVMELSSDAPQFKLRQGDKIFVDTSRTTIRADGKLYAVRSGGGELSLVRSEMGLDGAADAVRITFAEGHQSDVAAGSVEAIGVVRASLRSE